MTTFRLYFNRCEALTATREAIQREYDALMEWVYQPRALGDHMWDQWQADLRAWAEWSAKTPHNYREISINAIPPGHAATVLRCAKAKGIL